jgi:ATP-dependent DNA helicase RecG
MQNPGLKNPHNTERRTLAEISCKELSGVGPKTTYYLTKCGIHNLQDLLFHLPLRYENRTQLTAIKDARQGTHALITGIIQHDPHMIKSKKGYSCKLTDQTGSISLRFFNFKPKHYQTFKLFRTGLSHHY